MNAPEIARMLTISTAHVSPATRRLLETEAGCDDNETGLVIYPKDDVGWFVYVPVAREPACRVAEDGESISFGYPDAVPDDLQALLQYAESMDCAVLCLDRDAPSVPFLRTYDNEQGKPDDTDTKEHFRVKDVMMRMCGSAAPKTPAYQIEIHYAAKSDIGDVSVALSASDPAMPADREAIAAGLSEELGEVVEYDGVSINSRLLEIPASIVEAIRKDAVDAYIAACKESK